MSTPTTDAPGIVAESAAESGFAPAAAESASQTPRGGLAAEDRGDLAVENSEEESFKQLLRDFVLGRSQNPDDMPGLRFYVVFAGMLALALVGVAAVATLIGLIRWIGSFFR